MAQAQPTNVDKAAVLLTRLAPADQARVMELVGANHASRLKSAMEAVSRRSDFNSLAEQVLQEFHELQREVQAVVSDSSFLQRVRSDVANDSSNVSAESPQARPSGSPMKSEQTNRSQSAASTLSGPARGLLDMPSSVLATALQRETPRIMALVLKQLPTDFAAAVLEHLPQEQRQQVFLLLAGNMNADPRVIQNVLTAIAAVCQTIDPTTVGQQDNRLKTLTGILQTVEREERIRLMETLAEHDQELATQIDDCLYDYSDLLRIQDRSVQKLLSQFEQKVVAMAIASAPDELKQKIMKNLSERVRAALTEEMELLGPVPASKAEQARREIANVIRAQDKEGTLMWIE